MSIILTITMVMQCKESTIPSVQQWSTSMHSTLRNFTPGMGSAAIADMAQDIQEGCVCHRCSVKLLLPITSALLGPTKDERLCYTCADQPHNAQLALFWKASPHTRCASLGSGDVHEIREAESFMTAHHAVLMP